MKMPSFVLRALLILFALTCGSACLSDEVIPPYDDDEPVTDGFTRTGSSRLAPEGLREGERRDAPRVGPGQVRWPVLPRERLGQLRRLQSEEEVLALLGPPLRREVIVQGVDEAGADWNAWVWTWRFQDDELPQYAFVRDLELRFARVEERDVALDRAPVARGGWYLVGWELF